MNDAEARARVDLAAVYRLIAMNGWDDLIFTHVTARIPGLPDHLLINPFGVLFANISASNLVKIDLAGNIVGESRHRISQGGFVLHQTLHLARPDAHCILHTHTEAGMAVSAQAEGLLPISQHALYPLGSIAYHDYGGLVMDQAERATLTREAATAHHLVLRNHGLVTLGATPADAYLLMWDFERACRAQLLAQAGGTALKRIDASVAQGLWQADPCTGRAFASELIWPELLDKLDRLDPSFRR